MLSIDPAIRHERERGDQRPDILWHARASERADVCDPVIAEQGERQAVAVRRFRREAPLDSVDVVRWRISVPFSLGKVAARPEAMTIGLVGWMASAGKRARAARGRARTLGRLPSTDLAGADCAQRAVCAAWGCPALAEESGMGQALSERWCAPPAGRPRGGWR